uniref:Transporter, putative n=1 Tax=Theileria annulata TaxID=5874 RepID=A0A3B0MJ33_THEAN
MVNNKRENMTEEDLEKLINEYSELENILNRQTTVQNFNMVEDNDIEECDNPSSSYYSNFIPEGSNNGNIKGIGEFKDIDLSDNYTHYTVSLENIAVTDGKNEKEGILDYLLDSKLYLKHHDNLELSCITENINRNNRNFGHINRINPNLSDFGLGSISKYHRTVIIISFTLSFLSNFVGHFIREPLFTTKVNIQKSFGSSTLELEYLDISYLTLYGIGHLITPFVFSRSYVITFVSIFHFFLSITHFILFVAQSLGWFIMIYGITGFSCSVLWLSIYNDLHSWLPLKHRFTLLTIWCSSSELGLSLGTIMCAHIQNETRWKTLFMITAFINFVTGLLLFTCYIKPPRNSEQSDSLEFSVPETKLFDPVNISKDNINNIKLYFKGMRDNIDVFGVCKNMVEMSSKVVMGHLDLMKRVKYLFIYILGYTSLKSSRNCFAFWISFYLTTKLKYSIRSGIYSTFVFQMGSCLGSLIVGALSKVLLKKYHLLSCAISSLFSFLICPFIYFIGPNSVWKTFVFVFVFGLSTNSTDLLVTTRGLKTLCELSQEGGQVDDYSVSLGTTFSISTFLSLRLGSNVFIFMPTDVAFYWGLWSPFEEGNLEIQTTHFIIYCTKLLYTFITLLLSMYNESRKRPQSSPEELNKDKIQKTSQENDKVDPVKENLKEFVKENVPESDSNPEIEPEKNKPEPILVNKQEVSTNLSRTLTEDSSDLNVLEETYVLLDDDSSPSEASDKEENTSKATKSDKVNDNFEDEDENFSEKFDDKNVLDENRLVYEQLNTAYCSNLDYEHESILKEVGVDGNLGLLDQFDSDNYGESKNSNVIVSSNFGVSNVSVSTSENLPVGFFDDVNVDAKARGKLTANEAKNKIRELSKKRSTYLDEAKYVQEKCMENHREKLRMENDLLDHEETLKQLKEKVSEIKNTVLVDASNLKVEPENISTDDKSLDYDLDYDSLSWMSRSIL